MQHHLLFYDDAPTLIEGVSDFARAGLAADELVILVATDDHTHAITSHLAASGFDPEGARAGGQLLTLDAADTLAAFCHDGVLDRDRFDVVIGGLIRDATASGRPVRAFGEMVALLWEEQWPTAAVELEGLWETLGGREQFRLLCAYPGDALVCGDDFGDLNAVCEAHSNIVLSPKDPQHPTRLRAFPGSLHAVRDARRFVASCVGDRVAPQVRDDALLIASELAANAVYHAKTSFVVELSWLDDAVRIGVRDAYRVRPKLSVASAHSGTGRGISMIDVLSARWGVESHNRGKTVWAELAV